jgi:putative addiction module component (TIGR02574 family)
MSSVEQIAESALGLPVSDRTRLVVMLLESLDDTTPEPDVDQAWEAEVARRVRDLVEGRAKTIPAEQALRDVRAKLTRRR